MIQKDTRAQIIHYCHRMDQKGWTSNHDGNITVKIPGDSFAATPTARSKADLTNEDLIELDSKGKKIAGNGGPFSEMAVHLRAIVHAHPPSATAVGCANQELMTWAIPEAVVSLGPGIPLAGLALPNSDALWSDFDPLIAHYDAVMIGGNGVFAWGKTLEQAFLRLELVEHLAQICLKTLPLGGPKLLSIGDVQTLLKKRAEAGLALPRDPARPHWFG
jgi:L-fuculose-phosphate aldolase